ncbi:MAG TPA: hypothetical protein VMR79_04360 [Verrucomicrobiae bacterium]|nr:hypothetical protein [Verrucomicrobiae bacterium]
MVVVATVDVVVVDPGGALVVVDAALVVVVDTAAVVLVTDGAVVVVLPGDGHVPAPHASQQLDTVPTHAVPPRGALQAAALCLMLHRVVPCASVRQQATEFFLPQADIAAQCTTASWHPAGSEPSRTAALATCATHFTYCP